VQPHVTFTPQFFWTVPQFAPAFAGHADTSDWQQTADVLDRVWQISGEPPNLIPEQSVPPVFVQAPPVLQTCCHGALQWVCPGAHAPVHVPPTQVMFVVVQLLPVTHALPVQVSVVLPVQAEVPLIQVTQPRVSSQTLPAAQLVPVGHWPVESQVWNDPLLQRVVVGEQTPHTAVVLVSVTHTVQLEFVQPLPSFLHVWSVLPEQTVSPGWQA
jgi:hypothetical protein